MWYPSKTLPSSQFCVAFLSPGSKDYGLETVEVFLVPLFFLCPFLFVGGWCRLELCHFCKLWQEKCRIADGFRVLHPTLVLGLRVLHPSTPFRAQGFATQHSFWGLGSCFLSTYASLLSFFPACPKTKGRQKKRAPKKKKGAEKKGRRKKGRQKKRAPRKKGAEKYALHLEISLGPRT